MLAQGRPAVRLRLCQDASPFLINYSQSYVPVWGPEHRPVPPVARQLVIVAQDSHDGARPIGGNDNPEGGRAA